MNGPPVPLGRDGLRVWEEFSSGVSDVGRLVALCELVDGRAALRFRVLKGESSDWEGVRKMELRIDEARTLVGRDVAWQTWRRAHGG